MHGGSICGENAPVHFLTMSSITAFVAMLVLVALLTIASICNQIYNIITIYIT